MRRGWRTGGIVLLWDGQKFVQMEMSRCCVYLGTESCVQTRKVCNCCSACVVFKRHAPEIRGATKTTGARATQVWAKNKCLVI